VIAERSVSADIPAERVNSELMLAPKDFTPQSGERDDQFGQIPERGQFPRDLAHIDGLWPFTQLVTSL
jgi:hypothetical protein